MFLVRRVCFLVLPQCLASWVCSPSLLAERIDLEALRPHLVTSDSSGSHLASPGAPVTYAGLGTLDTGGVARIFVSRNDGLIECTGALLPTGRHVLTAAHCLSDSSGFLAAQNASLSFGIAAGPENATASDFWIHPAYDGQLVNGFDLAIIELSASVSAAVPRYDIHRYEVNPVGQVVLKVGYGRGGLGSIGESLPQGTLRTGLNSWDDEGLRMVDGISNEVTQLTYDFDSGLPENDAFAFFFDYPQNLGFGADEVFAAPGDSGGPSFVFVNGEPLVAGVASYGFRLNDVGGGGNSDVDAFNDSSWGEFAVDTNVAQLASWVLGVIPEPRSVGWVYGGVALLCALGRWRSSGISP